MNYTDLFSCKDKVAVVTGGAGLLGREAALGLRDFGAIVYIADTDEKKAHELATDAHIRVAPGDMTTEAGVRSVIGNIIAEAGRIDILVNSAYPRTADWGLTFEKIPFPSWNANVAAQLGGTFLCCQAAAEHMKARKHGSIINIASTYGVVAPDFAIYEGTEMTMPAAYSAVKGGIITFTKYLATYYAKHGVRVNALSPGGIFDNQNPAFVERYNRRTPQGRMAAASEMVGGIVYLASEASSYVTGHNLMIDGGWTAW